MNRTGLPKFTKHRLPDVLPNTPDEKEKSRPPMNTASLRSFRLVCKKKDQPAAEHLLSAQGFRFEPEPFSPFVRRLLAEPFPLGSSLAARFGLVYIQDRSSMLPPLALSPNRGAAVLDMCASPGSKTGFLAQLVGRHGFVLANEPSRARLATLRNNLASMSLVQCATTSFSGENLPLPPAPDGPSPAGGWPCIQLDPPCSGWGTVDKNPQVMDIWQGDKVLPLIALQRKLLARAVALLQPGGQVVYSTCTTNAAENEEQVRYAIDELGLLPVPLAPFPGFSFVESALPSVQGVLRVATGDDGQGFFIAAFKKSETAHSACLPLHNTGEPLAPDPLLHPRAQGNGANDNTVKPATGKTGKRSAPGQERASITFLPRTAALSFWVDDHALPAGELAVVNGVAHFLPAVWRQYIPLGTAWKGFALGKAQAGGSVRVNPALRGLMPSLDRAHKAGLPCHSTESVDELTRLLSGQSLDVAGMPLGMSGGEIGLYYRDMPLCRLSIKGKRALMPALF